MSSFSTVEVYSINDANFWYVETGDVHTHINPGCGASDLSPVHGERSQMRGKHDSQDHMQSYKDR